MNVIESEYDFDEIRATARQIDRGIQNLEKKLSNMNNLGYLLAPEDAKKQALDVLNEYESQIIDMRKNCEHCYEEEEKMLAECKENNLKVADYIERLKNDLNKIESQLKSNGNYRPYQEPTQEQDLIQNEIENASEKNCNESYLPECNNENQESELSAINHTETKRHRVPNEVNTTSLSNKSLDIYTLLQESNHADGLNHSNGSVLQTPLISKNSSKLYEKSYDIDSYSMSSLSLSCRKRSNYDDVCKTPIDPGISLASMQLLGKSNIKTKVYKSITFDDTHKD